MGKCVYLLYITVHWCHAASQLRTPHNQPAMLTTYCLRSAVCGYPLIQALFQSLQLHSCEFALIQNFRYIWLFTPHLSVTCTAREECIHLLLITINSTSAVI